MEADMDTTEYESLLDDESIIALKERRAAIGAAIEDLMAKMEQLQTQRRELDKEEESLYGMVKQLDAAHARLSRGVTYSQKAKKRVTRRFWTDETHHWVERFLYEWARKQLADGPKTVGGFDTFNSMRLSLVDAITVMKHHPEVFVEEKGPKPKQKYARASIEWSLKDGPARHSWSPHATYRWMEAALIVAAGRDRTQTHSEHMHTMLEEALKLFYAGQATSVAHAFNDLFWKEFPSSFHYYSDRVKALEAELARLKPADAGAAAAGGGASPASGS